MSGPCLRTKPKFIRLYTMLNLAPPTARGLLEFLWDSIYDTGEAIIGDADAIEAAAGWTGEPGKLCNALLTCGGRGKCGFIEEVLDQPGIYQLHDLLEHTPADQQRKWIRQQERKERGTTISEIRRAAANARWAKKHAADANADTNVDANSCKPMQMDDVCMPMQTCVEPVGQAVPDKNCVRQSQTYEASAPLTADAQSSSPAPSIPPIVPTFQVASDYFKSMAFYGDVNEFLARFQAAIKDPNSRAAKMGWQNEAYQYVCETQGKWASDFPSPSDMLRLGGKQAKADRRSAAVSRQ